MATPNEALDTGTRIQLAKEWLQQHDKTVKFDLADASMVASLFESLFAGGDANSVVNVKT